MITFYNQIIMLIKIQLLTLQKKVVYRVGILSAGRSYQVGDTVVFDDSVTSSFKASAKVSGITSSDISEISATTTTISNIEFVPISNKKYHYWNSNYKFKFIKQHYRKCWIFIYNNNIITRIIPNRN